MASSALEQALAAASGRLEAIGVNDDDQIWAPAETMALAFVGLDVNIRELLDIADHAVDPYAASVISAAAHAWQELQDADVETATSEIMSVGAGFGRHVQSNLLGVFCIGVLLGELHHAKRLEREATSDDG